jgi:hypothetical protein
LSQLSAVIDIFTLIGLLSFPPYLLYWIVYHVRLRAWRRLWGALLAVFAWLIASTGFFIFPMLGCMGGGCAEKVSPFLQFAVLYAFSSATIVFLLHRFRVKNAV